MDEGHGRIIANGLYSGQLGDFVVFKLGTRELRGDSHGYQIVEGTGRENLGITLPVATENLSGARRGVI
jgi:hypothetical protein